MNSFLEKIKTTKILAGVGTACMFLGTIIAYAKVTLLGYSANVYLYKHLEGIVIMIISIINFLFIFKEITQSHAPKLFETGLGKKLDQMYSSKLSLIPTGIAILMAIFLHMRLDFSLGFYTLYFGIICLVVYLIMHKQSD